jgi:electron transfer flavoprotein alpha subunit
MSYALIIGEVRNGVFEERNLDSVGICCLLQKKTCLLVPDDTAGVDERLVDTIVKARVAENMFLNPVNLANIVERLARVRGRPDCTILTHSSSGMEFAAYLSGMMGMAIITDVSGVDRERQVFLKSYYSDKIFGEFVLVEQKPFIVTVRSGSFKSYAAEKVASANVEYIEDFPVDESRLFLEYVEEEKSDIDIGKADFILSIGRGVGNKDEVCSYMELAESLRAVLSGSRPVIDKMWLPKARQVGTSGKTVKPKVYLAMGISGAFQHIAGMKESGCIIAVNKDQNAPIFQYAHYGIVADMHKVRDKLKQILSQT